MRAYLKIRTTYITLQIGWLFVWDSGFTLGTKLSSNTLQSGSEEFWTEVYASNSNQLNAVYNSYAFYDFQKQVRDNIGDYFRSKTLPFWNIIKLVGCFKKISDKTNFSIYFIIIIFISI